MICVLSHGWRENVRDTFITYSSMLDLVSFCPMKSPLSSACVFQSFV